MLNCPGCGRDVQAEWRFCRSCGLPLSADAPRPSSEVGEFVSPELLAHLLPPREMPGLLSKSLEIQEGQAALLFQGGRHDTTLGPGKHAISNILSSRGRNASVALFRTSDVIIDLSVPRLFTSDPLPLNLNFRLMIKIDQPLLLWTNLAAGADSYTADHVTGSLFPLVEEGCESFFKSRPIRDLAAHRAIGQDLQLALTSHMEMALARWGLRVVIVQGVNVQCEAWDEITKSRTEYFVTASRNLGGLLCHGLEFGFLVDIEE